MSHASVAAAVRKNKEAHPEKYCSSPGCLWRITSSGGPCPKLGHAKRQQKLDDAVSAVIEAFGRVGIEFTEEK